MSTTQQILLASRPQGVPTTQNFITTTISLPAIASGQVLLQGLYYSVDPYMRGRMNDRKSYVPPFALNQPITGGVVARVVESRTDNFAPGEYVLGHLPWQQQIVANHTDVNKVDATIAPPSYYLGILGMPGLTAYFGLLHIGKPQAGETVVVSGAAGAVGVVVGQLAKIKGCRVVGIADSNQKVQMLKETFGFDEAINYKTETNMQQAISNACPNGVDVYFDNVGGEISDAVIANINFHARIPLCGQISLYNSTTTPVGPRLQPMLLTRSVLMQGFIVSNFTSQFSLGLQQLAHWVAEGKLTYTQTIIQGFEKLPEALIGLFSGANTGKMVVEA